MDEIIWIRQTLQPLAAQLLQRHNFRQRTRQSRERRRARERIRRCLKRASQLRPELTQFRGIQPAQAQDPFVDCREHLARLRLLSFNRLLFTASDGCADGGMAAGRSTASGRLKAGLSSVSCGLEFEPLRPVRQRSQHVTGLVSRFEYLHEALVVVAPGGVEQQWRDNFGARRRASDLAAADCTQASGCVEQLPPKLAVWKSCRHPCP